ncbi:hypothetical protein AALO_G00032570 [Alosa alosa]|uniref:Uncharacterized protein n=1 Tax=Alosa alosa TaxID=278164 RepID=A0AAV6HG15_9TELE|nr:hypothetical protein AALO_G00032570 [Alosa alosa]
MGGRLLTLPELSCQPREPEGNGRKSELDLLFKGPARHARGGKKSPLSDSGLTTATKTRRNTLGAGLLTDSSLDGDQERGLLNPTNHGSRWQKATNQGSHWLSLPPPAVMKVYCVHSLWCT